MDETETQGASESTTETVEQFEDRIAEQGLIGSVPVDEQAETVEAAQVEGEADDQQPDASTSGEPAPKSGDDRIAEILAAQAETSRRQTELLERLTAKPATQAAPDEPKLIDQYRALLNDPAQIADVMRSKYYMMDPTNPLEVNNFRGMIYNAIVEEQNKEMAARLDAISKQIEEKERAETHRSLASKADAAWAKALSDRDADPELAASLKEAVDHLVSRGTDPDQAVGEIMKRFGKAFPKKATGQAPVAARSPEAAKAIATIAATGRPAARQTGFRRGTTSEASLREFEDKFLR